MVIVEFSVPDSLVALKKFSFPSSNDNAGGPSVYVSRVTNADDACSDPDHENFTSEYL